jgi:hypothetical protein
MNFFICLSNSRLKRCFPLTIGFHFRMPFGSAPWPFCSMVISHR